MLVCLLGTDVTSVGGGVGHMTDHGTDPAEKGPGFDSLRAVLKDHFWYVKNKK